MHQKAALTTNIFAIAIIAWVIFANSFFPDSYTISGGDVVQYFKQDKILDELNHAWGNLSGEGHFIQYYSYRLFYLIFFSIANLFNLSPTEQIPFYIAFFLYASYFSFYMGGRMLLGDGKANYSILSIVSLFYALNIYTLNNVFFYLWGYSPFLFLYICIPIILSAYIRFLFGVNFSFYWLAIFGIGCSLANIAGGNFPFIVSLGLILTMGTLSLLIPKVLLFNVILKRSLSAAFVALTSLSWVIVPQIAEMLQILENFNSEASIFDIRSWLVWQSITLVNVFGLTTNISWYTNKISILGVSWIFVFGLSVYCWKILLRDSKFDKKILFIIFCFLFTVFLINKGKGWLSNDLVLYLFNYPFLLSLRSYDKTLVFIPFLLLVPILLVAHNTARKINIALISLCMCILFASIFPYFLGGIQTKYSVAFDGKGDFRNSEHSYLIKIPESYKQVAKLINLDSTDYKVLGLPFSVINSAGWENRPKWQLVGIDPTTHLFNAPVINSNNYAYVGWNWAYDWMNEDSPDSLWLITIMRIMSIKYVIYHKDVNENFIIKNKDNFYTMVNTGVFNLIYDDSLITVYKIIDRLIVPRIYNSNDLVSGDLDNIKNNSLKYTFSNTIPIFISTPSLKEVEKSKCILDSMDDSTTTYVKISPVLYEIRIETSSDCIAIVFTDTYNQGWYIIDKLGFLASYNDPDIHHIKANIYQNAWVINIRSWCSRFPSNCLKDKNNNYIKNFHLVFFPDYLEKIFRYVSLSALLISVCIFGLVCVNKRQRNNSLKCKNLS